MVFKFADIDMENLKNSYYLAQICNTSIYKVIKDHSLALKTTEKAAYVGRDL